MRTPRRPPVPGGFGLPLGFGSGILATLLVVGAGGANHPMLSLVVLAVVVAGTAAVTTIGATLATGGLCWCLHAGFVLGREGTLVFTPAAGLAALVLACVAATALAVAATVRAAPHRLTVRPSASAAWFRTRPPTGGVTPHPTVE